MTKSRSTVKFFSKAASHYHTGADSHRAIAAWAATYLERFSPARVLEIGCGTGFLTEELVRLFPSAAIDALDSSPAMIKAASQLHPDFNRVRWLLADARRFQPAAAYNLITSSSALQWMQPLDLIFRLMASWLTPRGTLALCLMVRGTLAELRSLRAAIAPNKGLITDLPSVDETLAAAAQSGLVVVATGRRCVRQEYSSAEAFMRSIKELGFTGGPLSAAAAPLTRAELRHILREYQARYSAGGGQVYASFDTFYLEAQFPSF